jgi:hypothetical protein
MATRTFLVQRLTTNTVAVGGMSRLSFTAGYRDLVASTPDGATGAEDGDRAGLAIAASLTVSDITKVAAILAAPVGDTIYVGKESGTDTWRRRTTPGIVWDGFTMNAPRSQDASVTLTGRVRFADGTKTLADILAVEEAVSLATIDSENPLTFPTRLYRPYNFSFDPQGAAAAIALANCQGVTLGLTAEQFDDYGDDDVGMTAVDRGGFNALSVTLPHRDATVVAGAPKTMRGADVADADRGVLTIDFHGRGGAADQTLTVNNLLWDGHDETNQPAYADYSLRGRAFWRDSQATPSPIDYTLNGANKLFAFA